MDCGFATLVVVALTCELSQALDSRPHSPALRRTTVRPGVVVPHIIKAPNGGRGRVDVDPIVLNLFTCSQFIERMRNETHEATAERAR